MLGVKILVKRVKDDGSARRLTPGRDQQQRQGLEEALHRSDDQRSCRLALLRRLVAEGRYLVPAEQLASRIIEKDLGSGTSADLEEEA